MKKNEEKIRQMKKNMDIDKDEANEENVLRLLENAIAQFAPA